MKRSKQAERESAASFVSCSTVHARDGPALRAPAFCYRPATQHTGADHADRDVGMHQLRVGLEPWQAVEHGVDHGAVAVNQKLDVGVPGERNIGPRQNDRGTMVAAHSVKRDASLVRHGSTLAAPAWPPAASIGSDARGRP